jgi:putative transposase
VENLRTTNTIERLHEEFRRRVKTQGALPTEDAAVVQIKLRKIDAWQKIALAVSHHTVTAA